MDTEEGLPLGTYTLRKSKAPVGFVSSDDYFTFTISKDRQFVSQGLRNGMGAEAPIVFTNTEDANYEGGGIALRKTGVDGKPLADAEFGVLDVEGNECATLVIDEEGRAATGLRELPLGTYTVRETAAPAGYALSDETYTVELVEDDIYYIDVLEFSNASKTGSFAIEAQKKLEKTKLKDGQFSFELYATNDEGQAVLMLRVTIHLLAPLAVCLPGVLSRRFRSSSEKMERASAGDAVASL